MSDLLVEATADAAPAPDAPLTPGGDLRWVGPYSDPRPPGLVEASAEDAVVRKERKGSVLCLDGVPAGSMTAGADGAVVLIKHRRKA